MTKKQMEIIKDNLRACTNNFGYICIEKEDYGKGFYVFTSPNEKSKVAGHNIVIMLII